MRQKYIRRRTGLTIGANADNIPSNCHQITFANNGDVDFTVSTPDTNFNHLVGPYMELTLGDESHPEIMESNFYKVTFDPAGAGNKICSIERMVIEEILCG